MHFWTDRDGNKLTFKEFKTRWVKGIEGINELQQVKSQILFTRIVLLGISLGMVSSLIFYKFTWWLGVILFGAFGNTYIMFIGLKQKRKQLEAFENMVNLNIKKKGE